MLSRTAQPPEVGGVHGGAQPLCLFRIADGFGAIPQGPPCAASIEVVAAQAPVPGRRSLDCLVVLGDCFTRTIQPRRASAMAPTSR